MVRVLQISMGETFRGVEAQQLEIFREINKNIVFDFLSNNSEKYKKYKNEIEELGGKIYSIDCKRNTLSNKLKYHKKLKQFFKTHDYKIIHINSSAFFYILEIVLLAKKYNVKKIIVHSHNNHKVNWFKRIIISILRPVLIKKIDVCLSCSKEASNPIFKDNKNVTIIKNGLRIEKYKFNQEYREEYIKKYNLKNKLVLGHIGAFVSNKNHEILIDIFNEIQKKKDSILILVGEGEQEDYIKQKVKNLNLDKKVLFLGFQKDAYKILNRIDILVFPSLREGLGRVAIEAQTNGIITYCSTNVPIEAKISPLFRYFKLEESLDKISNRIISEKINISKRKSAYKYTIEKGYDIKEVGKKLEKIYFDLNREE